MSTSVSDDVKRSDMNKLLFDLLKHLTTLSSGSILVLLTVAEKILGPGPYPWQFKAALWLFVLSILSSFFAMIVVSLGAGPKGMSEPEIKWFSGAFLCTASLFTLAFILLATLATGK